MAVHVTVESHKQNTLFLMCGYGDCQWETKAGGSTMLVAKDNAEQAALRHIGEQHCLSDVTVSFE